MMRSRELNWKNKLAAGAGCLDVDTREGLEHAKKPEEFTPGLRSGQDVHLAVEVDELEALGVRPTVPVAVDRVLGLALRQGLEVGVEFGALPGGADGHAQREDQQQADGGEDFEGGVVRHALTIAFPPRSGQGSLGYDFC